MSPPRFVSPPRFQANKRRPPFPDRRSTPEVKCVTWRRRALDGPSTLRAAAPYCRSLFEVYTSPRLGKQTVKPTEPVRGQEDGCRAGRSADALPHLLHPRPGVGTTIGQRRYLPAHLSSAWAWRNESTTLCG